MVAGHDHVARVRARRRRDRRLEHYRTVADVKAGNGLAGRPARVPDHPGGHGAAHRLLPDPLRSRRRRRPAATARSRTRCFQEIDVAHRPRDVPVDLRRPRRAERLLLDALGGSSASGRSTSSTSTRSTSTATARCSSRAATPGPPTTSTRARGQILWTLGGKHSSFTEGRGARDRLPARRPPDRPATRFSCSTTARSPQRAPPVARRRARRSTRQTTRVSRARAVPSPGRRCSPTARETCRRSANGDWFVGWGQEPRLLGVQRRAARSCSTPACRRAISPIAHSPSTLERDARAERARRSRCAAAQAGDRLRELERGDRRRALAACSSRTPRERRCVALRTAARSGFETAIALGASRSGGIVEVRALDARGRVLGASAAHGACRRARTRAAASACCRARRRTRLSRGAA